MKIIEQLRERVTNLLTAPLDEVGRWTRFVRYQIELWRFCVQRLKRDNALAMSSALSFRTIFAIIPTLVLALLIVKSTGVLPSARVGIDHLLSAVGISQITIVEEPKTPPKTPSPAVEEPGKPPGKVVNLAETIEELVTKVERKLTFGRIGPVGVVLLIWTVLTLLSTMERSLNRIFDARRTRPLGRRILLYWSVVTLVPLLLVTAVYLGRGAAAALVGVPVISWLLAAIGWLAPIIVGVTVLAMVYRLMPNTHVSFPAALGGAAIAAPLWLVAKWGFSLYVFELVGRGHLYGALGLLPLFLLWLNLSWLIFLFGAEIAHVAVNLRQMQAAAAAESFVPTATAVVAAAVTVARSFQHGSGAVGAARVAESLKLEPLSAETLLEKLTALGVLSRCDAEPVRAYALARPAEKISMTEILEIEQEGEPSPAAPSYPPEIAEPVARFTEHARRGVGQLTLAELLAEDKNT